MTDNKFYDDIIQELRETDISRIKQLGSNKWLNNLTSLHTNRIQKLMHE